MQTPHRSLYWHHFNTNETTEKRKNLAMDDAIIKGLHRAKKFLQIPPILSYPDPSEPQFKFTDAPKYCWGMTLCQCTLKSNSLDYPKPITFISGKFFKTQYNYTTLSEKHLSFIYQFKDLVFYLQAAECTNAMWSYNTRNISKKEKKKTTKSITGQQSSLNTCKTSST